jgi:hypothetical protein
MMTNNGPPVLSTYSPLNSASLSIMTNAAVMWSKFLLFSQKSSSSLMNHHLVALTVQNCPYVVENAATSYTINCRPWVYLVHPACTSVTSTTTLSIKEPIINQQDLDLLRCFCGYFACGAIKTTLKNTII